MSTPVFNFTRVPEVKTRVGIVAYTLVAADNTLVIIGHMASSGSTATAGQPVQIANFGDPTQALTECNGLFGSGAEITEMVVAAIKGVLFSNMANKVFPPIVCIPLANADTSSSLATTLAALLTVPMPFVASCYAGTDSAALTALKNHLTAISGEDRGRFGQFGSFGFMGLDVALGSATPVGLSGASQMLAFPWLRDSAVTKANKLHAVTAATAAVCAANGVPYNPLTDISVGGLVVPASAADYHTPGDTGTEALGLANGIMPLMSNKDGSVSISRSVTSYRPDSATVAAAYFDIQDWQVLYYYRTQTYAKSQETQFKIAKASDAKAAALNSAFIKIAKDMEDLEMLQYVDKLAGEFTYTRSSQNRSAFVYQLPVNVIPGFYNKGIEILGTTKFDVVVA